MTHCGRFQRYNGTWQRAIGLLALLAVAVISSAISVWAAEPPLLLAETADVKYMAPGPRITYEITLTNRGSTPLNGVVVSDTLLSNAALLYLETPDGGKWSSTQRDSPEGPVALWVNETPIEPGQSVRLTYVVQLTWQNAPPGKIEKRTAVALADGIESSPAQDIVTALMIEPTPTELPSPTPEATATLAVPAPIDTATPQPTRTPQLALQVETPTQTPEAASVTTRETTAASTPAAPPAAAPPSGGSAFIIYIIVLVVIIAAAVLWLVTKKSPSE